jgi:hypothetical protein
VYSGRQAFLTALTVLFAVLSGTSAPADPRTRFTPEITVHGQTLPLRGTGRLVWMRVVTVYDAALYLPADVPGRDVLRDVPKRLELRYHISIKGERFGESAAPFLEKNVAAEELVRLKPRLEQLNLLYRDVKEGDSYSLTYVPGKGTTLTLNGNPLGTIGGADFAAAYFTIWLGERPISETMRDDLIGEARKK